MKKQLTKTWLTGYLICFAGVFLLITGVSYARMITKIAGTAKAASAAVNLDTTTINISDLLQTLQPGDRKELKFEVHNYQNTGEMSEVAQDYSVTVQTSGNLPLTFVLNGENTDVQGKLAEIGSQTGSAWKWTGGWLPQAQSVSHRYTLTVVWPADKNDVMLADEIERITLTVDAVQALPETSH